MKENIEKIAKEAVKIYFDYNISAKEAIKKAEEMIENEKKMDKMELLKIYIYNNILSWYWNRYQENRGKKGFGNLLMNLSVTVKD